MVHRTPCVSHSVREVRRRRGLQRVRQEAIQCPTGKDRHVLCCRKQWKLETHAPEFFCGYLARLGRMTLFLWPGASFGSEPPVFPTLFVTEFRRRHEVAGCPRVLGPFSLRGNELACGLGATLACLPGVGGLEYILTRLAGQHHPCCGSVPTGFCCGADRSHLYGANRQACTSHAAPGSPGGH